MWGTLRECPFCPIFGGSLGQEWPKQIGHQLSITSSVIKTTTKVIECIFAGWAYFFVHYFKNSEKGGETFKKQTINGHALLLVT